MSFKFDSVQTATRAIEIVAAGDGKAALEMLRALVGDAASAPSADAAPAPAPAPPAGGVAVDASVVRRARKAGLSASEARTLAATIGEQRAAGTEVDVAAAIRRYAALRSGRRDGGN